MKPSPGDGRGLSRARNTNIENNPMHSSDGFEFAELFAAPLTGREMLGRAASSDLLSFGRLRAVKAVLGGAGVIVLCGSTNTG